MATMADEGIIAGRHCRPGLLPESPVKMETGAATRRTLKTDQSSVKATFRRT